MSINFYLLDLRAFLAVYQFRRSHEAVVHLNLSQPVLSRRVQRLTPGFNWRCLIGSAVPLRVLYSGIR